MVRVKPKRPKAHLSAWHRPSVIHQGYLLIVVWARMEGSFLRKVSLNSFNARTGNCRRPFKRRTKSCDDLRRNPEPYGVQVPV